MAYEVTRREIDAYAELSHDFNPLHVDEDFARQSRFGGIIAHGFLSLAPMWQDLGLAMSYPLSVRCGFRRPARPGVVLRIERTPGDTERDLGFSIVDEGGDVIVDGHCSFGVHDDEQRP